MTTLLFVIGGLVLFPFVVYVLSKVQMLGWLNAMKQFEKEIRHGKKEE